jgi:hypothetical protein
MPLYMVRWPNGNLSIVKGRDRDDAVVLLDEVGDANGCPMKTITDDQQFMVNFKLGDSGLLERESFGFTFNDVLLKWAYPIIDKSMDHDGVADEAVEAERRRVKQNVTKDHPILKEYKTLAQRSVVAQSMGLATPPRRSRRKKAGESGRPTQSASSAEK